MTASLPPITSATKIVVKDSTDALEMLGTSGEVTEVTTTADGHTQLTIKGVAAQNFWQKFSRFLAKISLVRRLEIGEGDRVDHPLF